MDNPEPLNLLKAQRTGGEDRDQFYDLVYNVLIEECGASQSERMSFLREMTNLNRTTEWRFCGNLGFGGKYWTKNNRVNCYSEDVTPNREIMIERCNQRLATIASQSTERKSP